MSFGMINWRCDMYYPYFRGRQNELLCLRELLKENKLSTKVTPVLEPVRFNSTFFATLKKFIENDREIILIRNPKVGKFSKEYEKALKEIENEEQEEKKNKLKKTLEGYKDILKDEHIRSAYLLDSKELKKVLSLQEEERKDVYLLNQDKENENLYIEYGAELVGAASFIPKDEDFKDEVTGNTIILEDCYKKEKRQIAISSCNSINK